MADVECDHLYIIESLRDKDDPSGRWKKDECHDGTELYDELKKQGFPIGVSLHTPVTPQDFEVLVAIIRDAAPTTYPMLHLCMHGDQDGIQFTSMDSMSWKGFISLIRSINMPCQNNTVLTFSVCEAMYLGNAVGFLEPCPVWGFVANRNKTLDGPSSQAFIDFYLTYIKEKSLNRAVLMLNKKYEAELGAHPFSPFEVYNSEWFCSNALSNYRDVQVPLLLNEFRTRLAPKYQLQGIQNPLSVPHILKEIDETIEKIIDEKIEVLRSKFYMLDRYPESRGRYTQAFSSQDV